MDKQTPEIGPVTALMLQALRSLEIGRESYLEALQKRGGETYADQVFQQNAGAWDAVADILKGEIADAVEGWATRADAGQL